MELKKNITQYLKKAVLAQVDRTIDFKNDEFYKINREDFLQGNIDPNITLKLFQNNQTEERKPKEQIDENLYVILAVKVIRIIEEGSQKKDDDVEDLTGIYFVPAMLNRKNSNLLPSIEDNKLPWFPREFLKPIIEPELAIGDNIEYEKTLSDNIYRIYDIVSWEDYVKFCIEIYEKTTGCEFNKDYLYNYNSNKDKILLEENVYIFADKTINPVCFIKSLYEDILQNEKEMPLYDKFIKLEKEEDNQIQENTTENRRLHLGQMGGAYGLSDSQREGINHFNHQETGEILAIKGPPGTGKTTLIQSIVANEYVKRAVQENEPPLIVASSTNNQAVTNIIESFGKIQKQYKENNLETRWIEKVNSFAVYFPSNSKRKQAKEKHVQYTDNRGNFFVADVDNEENIKKSKEKFIQEATKIFGEIEEDNNQITTYKHKIHNQLKEIIEIQNELIDIVNLFSDLQIEDIQSYLAIQQSCIEKIKSRRNEIHNRMLFWNTTYNKLPIIWKMLSFLRTYKLKISNALKIYQDETEDFNTEILDTAYIEKYYVKKVEEQNAKIRETKLIIQKVEENKKKYEINLQKLKRYHILDEKIITKKDELDKWLDIHTRYLAFWLSVHYYEARWLEGENKISDKQKGTNFANVITMSYERLALIAPCMVMTFYMLPKQFEIWDGTQNGFLYNLIDLLIVDEAGQVSTEIAACSFALAKKAVVVGDEYQIAPVWAIEKALDKSLALQEKVIEQENEFSILEEYGITASNSNVMKVACKSCKFSKYGEKGLFLQEHRRCFNKIIQYCNDLVYNGKLMPLRGEKRKDGTKDLLPKMGYKKVETLHSQKVGTSRINVQEALEIVKWIKENYVKIFEYYKEVNPNNVIGIITPFKAQAATIRRLLKQILPQEIANRIIVGTIHVLQGGERKIIIMSTTYGKEEGCFFIDNNKSLMNVAVSRAEDSFLVFGNIECLNDEITCPSGLLKNYIKDNLL